jgi:acyl-coenzyme A synthetase/AMP-(fatty) acid ligase
VHWVLKAPHCAASEPLPQIERLPGLAPGLHDDLALLLSTSGSTGSPKLVRLASQNVSSNAWAIAEYLGLAPGERAITSLPLHYSYGLSVLNSHLAAGATVILTEEPVTARPFWELFQRESVTSLAGVPKTWEILRSLRIERMSLPSLRYCTQAGGRLAAEHVTHFAKWAADSNRRFYVMYGQTEATARMSYMPPERLIERPTSIGRPIPGGKLWITDDSGGPVGRANVPGELVYSGPNVMMGYACNAEDLARGDELHGILHTGDLGFCDDDGFFHLTGRRSRFIKVFGNRVGLEELESWLQQTGHACAVTGEDDHLLIAAVGGDTERIRKMVCERLHVHFSAVEVRMVEQLPRNAAGKILYGELRRLAV